MQDLKAELLRGLWYVALLSAELRPGRMVHKTLLGEPLLIGRGRGNRVFALRDNCPHRGIPLHYGHFDGDTIACCYHGWRFDMSGTCVEIPRCARASRWTRQDPLRLLSVRRAAGPDLGLFPAGR